MGKIIIKGYIFFLEILLKTFYTTIFALLFVFLSSFYVESHPHSWVEIVTTLNFHNGKLASVRTTFTFDEMNSMYIMEEADTNGNDRIEQSEVPKYKKAIGKFVARTLKNNDYFTHFKVNGKMFSINLPEKIKANYKNQKLSITFTLTPSQPLDPVHSRVAVNFFDESYYHDVFFSERLPVRITGTMPTGCSFKTGEDINYTYYFDSINPISVDLVCKGN